MKTLMWKVVSPPAEVSTHDTGLRFTDVLFGFVIREIFIRLQQWNQIDWVIRWQLIVAGLLVLGSFIGFRRSLNRSDYEVKFVNLPLLRFVLDQGMIVLYFKLSSLSGPSDKPLPRHAHAVNLTRLTVGDLVWIFGLYLVWDFLGMCMAWANDHAEVAGMPKYPQVKEGKKVPDKRQDANWWGLVISILAMLLVVILKFMADRASHRHDALVVLVLAAAVLFAYRFFKEVRSSLTFKPSPA